MSKYDIRCVREVIYIYTFIVYNISETDVHFWREENTMAFAVYVCVCVCVCVGGGGGGGGGVWAKYQ